MPPTRQISRSTLGMTMLTFAIALITTTPAIAENLPTLILDIRADSSIREPLSGRVQIVVTPPFAGARIDLALDGRSIVNALAAPYRIDADLGSIASEHSIEVTARDARGKAKARWSALINQGLHPFDCVIDPPESPGAEFQIRVRTASGDDVETIEVWGSKLIARLDSPPWRFRVSETGPDRVLRAIVTSRSGRTAVCLAAESADDVYAESFEVRTVEILVAIESAGSRVTDLALDDIRIHDDRIAARVLSIESIQDEPIDIALLLDASSSMELEIARVAKVASRFLERNMRPEDRLAIFAIQSTPRRLSSLTGDRAAIQKALETLQALGQTALRDSIAAAIRELKSSATGRRAILVLSDGADTSSFTTWEELNTVATNAGIPIDVIFFGGAETTSENERLRYVAAQTGGFVTTSAAHDLESRFDEIARDLRAQYRVRYEIRDIATPNRWREVTVRLKPQGVKARTVSGYVSP